MAPELSLRADEEPRHRPRVLAFVRAWSLDREPEAELARVRRRLANLDAELVVVCDEGAWSFTRDGAPTFCDRLAADVATAAAVYGVRSDAVFVIDPRGVVRFAHAPERPLSATLSEALDAAGEALQWRDQQTPLERVQWSAREWALKCLVVGCALTFVAGYEPVAASAKPSYRFARGTGPIRTCGSRVAITPRADASAPLPQLPVEGERPDGPTPRRPS
jgi:hypothetical protein